MEHMPLTLFARRFSSLLSLTNFGHNYTFICQMKRSKFDGRQIKALVMQDYNILHSIRRCVERKDIHRMSEWGKLIITFEQIEPAIINKIIQMLFRIENVADYVADFCSTQIVNGNRRGKCAGFVHYAALSRRGRLSTYGIIACALLMRLLLADYMRCIDSVRLSILIMANWKRHIFARPDI